MTRKSDRELRRLEEAQKLDAEAETESMESAITIDLKKISGVRLD